MKKSLFILLALVAVGLPSFAYITPEQAASTEYIEKHGHSVEMARLVNLQNQQINEGDVSYKSKNPAKYSEKKINFIRNAFMYFDCGLDDERFMQHDTAFTPRWNEDY